MGDRLGGDGRGNRRLTEFALDLALVVEHTAPTTSGPSWSHGCETYARETVPAEGPSIWNLLVRSRHLIVSEEEVRDED